MSYQVLKSGEYSDRRQNQKWKTQWERYVWYSKKKDQLILSDSFLRTRTCNQCPETLVPEYIPPSFVYLGEI